MIPCCHNREKICNMQPCVHMTAYARANKHPSMFYTLTCGEETMWQLRPRHHCQLLPQISPLMVGLVLTLAQTTGNTDHNQGKSLFFLVNHPQWKLIRISQITYFTATVLFRQAQCCCVLCTKVYVMWCESNIFKWNRVDVISNVVIQHKLSLHPESLTKCFHHKNFLER